MRVFDTYIIYAIRSWSTNAVLYVGSTGQFKHRITNHISQLKCGRHVNPQLQSFVDFFGVEDLWIEQIAKTKFISRARSLELHYINTIGEFNVTKPSKYYSIGDTEEQEEFNESAWEVHWIKCKMMGRLPEWKKKEVA